MQTHLPNLFIKSNTIKNSQQGIIYKATNIITGKCYVGKSTKSINYRIKGHNRPLIDNNYFHRALRKYRRDNFIWEEIWSGDTSLLNIMETFKIMVNHSHKSEGGYNLTWGGEGISGFKHTKETKQKMSINNVGFKGKKHSEETKQKISKGNKGKKRTIETKQKMSKIKQGKMFTEEHKRKISKSGKGKHFHQMSEETKQKISKGNKGKKRSKSDMQKMSENRKGKNNPFYGKHHSEETKRKISKTIKDNFSKK